jgi:hypothetical protein
VPEIWVVSFKGMTATLVIGRVPETWEVRSIRPNLEAAIVPETWVVSLRGMAGIAAMGAVPEV